MKINFNQQILDWEGQPILDKKTVEVQGKPVEVEFPLTLKKVALNSLGAIFQDEQNLTGEEKMKRFKIGMNISNAKDSVVDIESQDIADLKKVVAKMYSTVVVGYAWNMLETPMEVVK